MKKTAFLLILITISSKVLGFGREITLSYFYGTSYISDAYIIALTIPLVIFAFIGKGITSSYIPMYNRISKQSGTEDADLYTSNIINILILLCTIISLLSLIYTEQLVKLFASGFNEETLNLTVRFTRYGLLGLNITMLINIFSALLQIKGNYRVPAMVGFPMNICIIFTIIISNRGNIHVLGMGLLLSVIAQFLFMIPFVLKSNFKYKFDLKINDPNVRNMVFLAIPVIIGVAVNDINKIVDKAIASQISEGAISALNYANKLNSFVQGTFVLSIATVIYPIISKMAVNNEIQMMKKTVSEAIISISILVIPTTIAVLFLSNPIVVVIFGRGAFNNEAILMTSNALFFYSFGMLGVGIREILTRPFYALQDTKTPMINATIGMGLNIILNIILSRYLGIGGLALATSLSATFTMVMMLLSLQKRIGSLGIRGIVISLAKVLFASLVMGGIVKLAFNYLVNNNYNQSLVLISMVVMGTVIYFWLIYVMKIREVDMFVNSLKKRIIKKID